MKKTHFNIFLNKNLFKKISYTTTSKIFRKNIYKMCLSFLMQYKSSNPSVKNTLKHKFLTCNLDYQKPKPLNVILEEEKIHAGPYPVTLHSICSNAHPWAKDLFHR